jgi:hypothetical protein
MICIKFPCGDLQPVTIIKYEGEEVCVKMPFGPFWTDKNRLMRFG